MRLPGLLRRLLRRFARRDQWAAYAQSARRLGLRGPALFLSFDCDTDLDAEAARHVGAFLCERGIQATFAVPGVQLERGRAAYRALAADGFEFMNHGLRPHADFDGQKYYGITFYDQMPLAEVEADIREADALLREILGTTAHGFRAPHFGSFQRPEQVAFMHDICRDLGYAYTSTTLPAFAFAHGPAYLDGELVELPVLGSWAHPDVILDSWNHLEDRVHYRLGDAYLRLFAQTLDAARRNDIPMLLTWYADPCHVCGQPPFEEAMHLVARLGIPTYSGAQCAALMRQALSGAAPCAA